jgi:hypothetical protein
MTANKFQQNTGASTQAALTFSSKKIWTDFELAILGLAILSLVGQSIKYLTVYDEAFGLIPLVNMGKALSIPTIFSVLEYFIVFLLLAIIAIAKQKSKDQFRWQWSGLAGLFLYLAFDKGTAVHTYVFKEIRGWARGFMPFFPSNRWIFSLVLIAIILVLFYIRFIKTLPKDTRKHALISMAVYYLGFLVLERFAKDFSGIYGADSLTYSILLTLGKTLEMSGLAAAILTALKYLALDIPDISLEL